MIEFGILAAGSIAQKMAGTLRSVEGVHLLAVASREKEKAESFARRYGAPRAYGSYRGLMEDADVDVIYIATPHSHHFEVARECLEHGKNLLIEKPVTVNAAQAEELFRLAEQKHLFVMEAMWMRFLPGMRYVLDLVRQGAIGEVKRLTADFGMARTVKLKPRQFLPELAGGVLLDMGIYCLTLASMLFGDEPSRVVSACEKNEYGTDQQDAVALFYPGGRQAVLSCSLSADSGSTAVIGGTAGSITLPRFVSAQKVVLLQHREIPVEVPFVNPACGFEYEVRHVAECLNAGKTVSGIHPPEQTIAMMRLMDRIRKDWSLTYPCE